MVHTQTHGHVKVRRPLSTRDSNSGQATLAAALAVLLFVVAAGGLVDLVRLWDYRLWAYRVAEAAALAGAAAGRDYTAYVATGALTLDPVAARDAAEQALLKDLATRDVAAVAAYDVRVHPAPGPGSYPGYPPLPHAAMGGAPWSPTAPAVGVYLTLPVQPVLHGWINGGREIDLHVFAAAGVSG